MNIKSGLDPYNKSIYVRKNTHRNSQKSCPSSHAAVKKHPAEVPASLTWRKTLLVATWGTASPVARHIEGIQQTIN